MEKNIGVWLDSDKAYIINNEDGSTETVLSEMEHYHSGGGAGTKTPYGTQNATSEGKLEERKKHQMKKYFEEIKNHISDANNFVVFGPGEMKVAFNTDIQKDASLQKKLRAVETASNTLTPNQLKEWVRDFYSK